MFRRLALCAGALLVLSSAPAHAGAAVDHRATPTVTVSVWPRYPLPGDRARLSIRVGGAHGPATGWVRVRFDGAVIPACRHLTLRRGATTCTAPATWASRRTFLVGYRGSAVYRARVVTRIAHS